MKNLATYLTRFEERRYYVPAFLILCAVFIATEASLRNDFDIFLSAAGDLFLGKNVYRETYFDGYHYYYSTLFGIILYPLTLLPAFVAKSIWIVINLASVFRMLYLLNPWIESMSIQGAMKNVIKLGVLLFCLRFLKGNVHLGQMTIFILYLSLESLHQLRLSRTVSAAILLALAINIKVLPIVLIPYFLYRNHWRMTIYTGLLLVVMALLPGLWIGYEYNQFLWAEWWNLVNPAQSKHLMDVEETSFHGLSTVLPILFMENTPDRSTIDISRNILNLPFEQVVMILTMVRLIFVLGTLWFLRSLPFRPSPSVRHEWWELSYIFLCIPLIFPHQQHYAFLFMWPALAYLITYASKSATSGIYKIFLTLIFISINAALFLGFARNYFEHFKIVTIGALICTGLLIFSRPEKLSFEKTS